jgi:hypothetical protein
MVCKRLEMAQVRAKKGRLLPKKERFFRSKMSSFLRNELGCGPLFSMTWWLRSFHFNIFLALRVP